MRTCVVGGLAWDKWLPKWYAAAAGPGAKYPGVIPKNMKINNWNFVKMLLPKHILLVSQYFAPILFILIRILGKTLINQIRLLFN